MSRPVKRIDLSKRDQDKGKKLLTFHVKTGELIIVKNRTKVIRGDVVVDQIYRDGFFGTGLL
jgi:hypothetical protein